METSSKMKKHWLVLLTVALLYGGNLGLGANTLGVYYTPVSESLGILRGDFAMNSTLTALVSGIFSLFVPNILEKYSWKKAVTIGSVLTAFSLFAMGLTTSVALFNVLGVVRGLGIALTTFVSGAALINQWFREKNGLAISLATSFSGLTSIIFSPVFSRLIAMVGWEWTFIVHGVITLFLCLPAIIYPFTFDPRHEGLMPYGASNEQLSDFIEEKNQENIELKSTFGIASFSLILMATLQTAVVGINQHLPSYGLEQGLSVEGAGLMLSAAMFGNMTFKLLTGFFNDFIGGTKTMFLIIGLNTFALFALIFWSNPIALIFLSWLYGAIFGTAVSYVVLSKQLFGLKLGNRIYSVMIFSASMAVAITNLGIGYLFDFMSTYKPAFWLGILLQIVSMLLLLVAIKFAPASFKRR